MKRLIALRKRYQAFGRGDARVPPAREPQGAGVPARRTARSASSSSPTCRASRSTSSSTSRASRATTPVELFGGVEFPRIGELPYLLDARPARLLLVLARAADAAGGAASAGPVPQLGRPGPLDGRSSSAGAGARRSTSGAARFLLRRGAGSARRRGGMRSASIARRRSASRIRSTPPARRSATCCLVRVEYARGRGGDLRRCRCSAVLARSPATAARRARRPARCWTRGDGDCVLHDGAARPRVRARRC